MSVRDARLMALANPHLARTGHRVIALRAFRPTIG
jgi:hypothetical protein